MHASTLNLLSPEFIASPYAELAQLREETPVTYLESMNMYLVTSFQHVREVVINKAVFSSKLGFLKSSSEEAIRIINEKGYGQDASTLQNNDQPSHTFYRKLADNGFRPKRMRQMTGYVKELAQNLIDDFAQEQASVNIVPCFALPIPMIMIAEQIGMPRKDFKLFKRWCDAWMIEIGGSNIPTAELVCAAHLVVELQQYLAKGVEGRRASPREDILSDFANAKKPDGSFLEVHEILSMVEQLLVAGNKTTISGIAAGLHLLGSDLELQHRLRSNSEDIPLFIEELMRTESPIQSIFRRSTEDTELGGVKIAKDSIILIHFGAANRDPERFINPDVFDIDRKEKGGHLAFGSGIHHCVGSELARVEMKASFTAFLERFQHFETVELAKYEPLFLFRMLKRVPLILTPTLTLKS